MRYPIYSYFFYRYLNHNTPLLFHNYVKDFRHLEINIWSLGFEEMPTWLAKGAL